MGASDKVYLSYIVDVSNLEESRIELVARGPNEKAINNMYAMQLAGELGKGGLLFLRSNPDPLYPKLMPIPLNIMGRFYQDDHLADHRLVTLVWNLEETVSYWPNQLSALVPAAYYVAEDMGISAEDDFSENPPFFCISNQLDVLLFEQYLKSLHKELVQRKLVPPQIRRLA